MKNNFCKDNDHFPRMSKVVTIFSNSIDSQLVPALFSSKSVYKSNSVAYAMNRNFARTKGRGLGTRVEDGSMEKGAR